MLDAFIIDQLRREKDRPDQEFVPITLELPVSQEETGDEEEEPKQNPESIDFRF